MNHFDEIQQAYSEKFRALADELFDALNTELRGAHPPPSRLDVSFDLSTIAQHCAENGGRGIHNLICLDAGISITTSY